LRDKSYRYKSDEALGTPYKSYAFLPLKSRITKVEILVKNMIQTGDEYTWELIISK